MSGTQVYLQIVYDNHKSPDKRFRPDWGFGCVVNTPKGRILFDTGANGDLLLANLKALEIDIDSIDKVVISHQHYDHVGGLKAFLKKRKDKIPVYVLASFPESIKRTVTEGGDHLIEVHDSLQIVPGIYTTGEIGGPIPEQALVVSTKEGSIVVTGCAHPGIAQMVESSLRIPPGKIYAAVGGFHLKGSSRRHIEGVIEKLKTLGVKKVIPLHCTGDEATRLLKEAFGKGFIPATLGSTIPLP